ncbi:hypothetical protein YC2023_098029 [Brassica napus]
MGLQRRRKKTIMTLRPRDVEETHINHNVPISQPYKSAVKCIFFRDVSYFGREQNHSFNSEIVPASVLSQIVPPHLSFFNVFFFYKTTNPMREEAAGCQITIHDTGREKGSSLTDHDLRRQPLL